MVTLHTHIHTYRLQVDEGGEERTLVGILATATTVTTAIAIAIAVTAAIAATVTVTSAAVVTRGEYGGQTAEQRDH